MARIAVAALELAEADLRTTPSPIAPRHAHVCVACHQRRSLFRYRGAVRADCDHTLCFRCYRALRDSVRARLLARAA